jgi:pimeloyl-ACP methyl ester carboxylesterase
MHFLLGVGLWLSIESVHYLYIRNIVYKKVCLFKNKSSTEPNAYIKSFFDLLASLKTYSLQKWIEGIFMNKSTTINLDNFVSCMAWIHHYSPIKDITADQLAYVSNIATQLFDQFQGMDSQIDPNTKHMELGMGCPSYFHIPLCISTILDGMNLYYSISYFYMKGFKQYKCGGLTYLVYLKEGSTKDPYLFMHGITIGLHWYSYLIDELMKERSVFLVVNNGIIIGSMNTEIQCQELVVCAVKNILERHDVNKVSLIGHSWGTFWAAWIVRGIPHRVSHLTMLDPLANFIIFPETTYYICYKPPVTWVDYFVYYFIRNDLAVSNSLHHLRWYDIFLEYKNIPNDIGVIVCIGGKDELLHIPSVLEITDNHIASRPKEAARFIKLYYPDFIHGECKNNPDSIKELIQLLNF